VAKLIKGKRALAVKNELLFLNKRAAGPILKLLNSALAIAEKNNLNKEDLILANIIVSDGPKRKTMRPGSRGRAKPIIKRASHIELALNMNPKSKTKKPK
jgi:large subunit ribosomal protein L22